MTNAQSKKGQMAVCCENLTLGVLSRCSVLSMLVGALFKKFSLFLNMSYIFCSHLLSIRLKRLYRNVILCIVLYGFEIWFLILKGRHKVRVFQSRIMRKIFGTKRVEETGKWRKLHYEGFMICVPQQMLFG